MTVHAAKGLEFSVVAVPHCVEQRFPTRARAEPLEIPAALLEGAVSEEGSVLHLEEERRLFYVAATRAKEVLLLTAAARYGGGRARRPSRFWSEMGLTVPAQEAPSLLLPIPEAPPAARVNPASREGPLSFTQLTAFETCPLQYKFAHVLRIPVRPRGPRVYGETMHRVIERFLRMLMEGTLAQESLFERNERASVILPPLATLQELFVHAWSDEWFESALERARYRSQGEAALARMYKEWGASPPHPRALEWQFRLAIEGVPLKGTIDRIDELPDGNLQVIDYKTGRKRPDDEVDKTQLLIYHLAVTELWGRAPVQLTYYYVDSGETFSFTASAEELEKLRAWVRKTAHALETSPLEPTPSSHVCRYCDFRDICEFRAN
jgi:DNA helicase-2/ATP-dependent DNA helicase PcrA